MSTGRNPEGGNTVETTICEIDDGQSTSQETVSSKPQISFILTVFNIICSSVGIGVLFLPSTLCGAGIIVGVVGIILIGLAADWSSRALIEVTCKSKSKSLEDMFKKVLGPAAANVYSVSVVLLLIGALSIFIVMMGMQLNDVFKGYHKTEVNFLNFRKMSVLFSLICGLSLLFRDLKVLSYVSIIKVFVLLFILLVAMWYGKGEYDVRRETHSGKGNFSEEFPFSPTLLGFMKAMGSWLTAYLFHMGVSDMYFSLRNASSGKWNKISRRSCLIIAILNVSFAVVGYLATADQLITTPDQKPKDLCAKGGVIFLSIYDSDNKWIIHVARLAIVLILLASYPLIFYFLKQYTILVMKKILPSFDAPNVITFGVWLLILLAACTTNDPFVITNFVVSIVGTIVVFLMPVLCWIQISGGFSYVFSLGIYGENSQTNVMNKNVIDVTNENEDRLKKPSIIAMLSAQSVFFLSCAFIIIGVTISPMELYQGGDGIHWRQTLAQFPRKEYSH